MRALLALIMSTLQSQALVKEDRPGVKGDAEVVQEGDQPAGSEDVEAEDGGLRQAKEQMFSDKMT